LQVTWAFLKTGELPRHDPTHVAGVAAEEPLVGEAMVEGEELEHGRMGQTQEEWDRHRPHWPAGDGTGGKDGKDGGAAP
jgi:hypothetical protein